MNVLQGCAKVLLPLFTIKTPHYLFPCLCTCLGGRTVQLVTWCFWGGSEGKVKGRLSVHLSDHLKIFILIICMCLHTTNKKRISKWLKCGRLNRYIFVKTSKKRQQRSNNRQVQENVGVETLTHFWERGDKKRRTHRAAQQMPPAVTRREASWSKLQKLWNGPLLSPSEVLWAFCRLFHETSRLMASPRPGKPTLWRAPTRQSRQPGLWSLTLD